MFDKYDIQIITKTINTVSDIDNGYFAYESTLEDEGIIEIRITDTEEGCVLIGKEIFVTPVDNETAFPFIVNLIKKYEDSKID